MEDKISKSQYEKRIVRVFKQGFLNSCLANLLDS